MAKIDHHRPTGEAERVRHRGDGHADDGVLVRSDEEGARYRDGVYDIIDVTALERAPADPEAFPDPGTQEPFHRNDDLARVPKLKHVIGPSFVALGIGLGAGEFLLWPNLIAANGFNILWLFVIGVAAQFVMISEIQRWTVATGESIFSGMTRMTRGFAFWPWFFVAASLIAFFWPGWAAQSASFIADTVNTAVGSQAVTTWQPIAIGLLVFAYLILALSTVVYNALERFEIYLIAAFFPLLLIAALLAGATLLDVADMGRGFVGLGEGNPAPRELLSGDQFPTLLIAVAYAGSGGTLLLGQSLWVRDKGFGLARYQGRIMGIRGTNEGLSQPGFAFDVTKPTLRQRFRRWMRLINAELSVAFAIPILVSVALTGLVVAATIGLDNADLAGDLTGMVQEQADVLTQTAGTWLALIFLVGGALVLFSTQFGIMDTITRITGDIVYEQTSDKGRRYSIKAVFLTLLTLLTAAAVAIVVMSWMQGTGLEGEGSLQPNFLIIIAGPFTIASMYVFGCVIAILNTRYLPPGCRMTRTKLVSVYLAILLWGWFTAEQISRTILEHGLGVSGEAATTISMHPVRVTLYALLAASIVYVVARTFMPGFLRRPVSTGSRAPAPRPD